MLTPCSADNTKAIVGLGFELPAEVLAATKRAAPMAGLGIYMDFSYFDVVEDEILLSPPMLAPRRSPRRVQADSPGTELAPMRTPSPSLLVSTSDVTLHLPAPSVPSLPCTPILACDPFQGSANAGLGIDLPGLDAHELVLSYRERYLATAGVGLGLGLSCLDDAELITTIEPLSTSQKGLGIDLSFLEEDEFASFIFSPLLTSVLDARDIYAHPKPRRAYLALGFALNSVDESEDADHSPTSASPRPSPSLGFDSPFWVMYTAAMQNSVC